jgi:GDP-D-mannose 3',5'-epimerase
MKSLVTGAGGFIGSHLVEDLQRQGHEVVAVDVKHLDDWFNVDIRADNFWSYDLTEQSVVRSLLSESFDRVYNLACDMGGMGFIENNKAACMVSSLINTNLIRTFGRSGLDRYFYSSSACVYNADKQRDSNVTALKESDAYPAMPEDGYGWEKLFSERMCKNFLEDFGTPTRVARFHNVYGERTSYDGGREKAPAAICRKVIEAKMSGKHDIEIWGDGTQTRSFMYITDCIKGINLLTDSDWIDPVNVGSSELVSINQLVDIVEEIADIKLERNYKLDAPQGVRGRNSDNTLIKELFDWEPSVSLRDGLEKTFKWVWDEMNG